MSQDVLALAERYLTLWNEPDDLRRRVLAEEVFTADGEYTDPNTAARGAEAITAYINTERKKFGDLVFTIGQLISAHHGVALFTWELGPAGAGAPVATGYDTVFVDGGRLRQVYGFFA
ncbi:nuclear transport factor 2 family protein [Streptomyces sp. AP-93]|uniref:nuclear transport factor 2 family protein n=1 Tax=Streptomyces sp. AP-93 TaxID=2929048 RepID=UPI001FAF0057|nr:nuclear transport factor 2 family protein [Streptomyces sp. AP-93]MCJ0873075.1 nuclear transport factor 2 family protein [Streptomyces sp. AP-93]